MSSDSRDSAIQIFDKFMSVMLPENIEADTDFISYAVAVSIVISSKLHESRRRLSLLSFQDFRIDLLKHFERLILSKIGLSIAPQITPTAFVVELLILWQPNSQYPPPCPKNFGYGFFYPTIIKIADSLIAEFWEGQLYDIRYIRIFVYMFIYIYVYSIYICMPTYIHFPPQSKQAILS
jgi:hypothetical protein